MRACVLACLCVCFRAGMLECVLARLHACFRAWFWHARVLACGVLSCWRACARAGVLECLNWFLPYVLVCLRACLPACVLSCLCLLARWFACCRHYCYAVHAWVTRRWAAGAGHPRAGLAAPPWYLAKSAKEPEWRCYALLCAGFGFEGLTILLLAVRVLQWELRIDKPLIGGNPALKPDNTPLSVEGFIRGRHYCCCAQCVCSKFNANCATQRSPAQTIIVRTDGIPPLTSPSSLISSEQFTSFLHAAISVRLAPSSRKTTVSCRSKQQNLG